MSQPLQQFARYETYQDSGVEWLGEIPTHWSLKKLKLFSSLKARIGFHGLNSSDFQDDGAYCITGTDFNSSGGISFEKSYHVSENWYLLDKNIQVRNGDVLVTKDGTIGKVAVVSGLNKNATLNSGVFLLRPKLDSKNIYWQIKSNIFTTQVAIISRGSTINHLYERDFKNFSFVAPPLPEQTAIAHFLDQKTAEIDQAIALKTDLIERLKEYKQITIQHAVTRGLDPNAKMKASGVEWIGDIPNHWVIERLRRYAEINPSIGSIQRRSDDLVCFLPMETVSANGQVDYGNRRKTKEVSQGFTQFRKKDVIVAKITPCFENGKSAFLEHMPTDFGYGSTEFHVLRPKSKLTPQFLYHTVSSHVFLKLGEALMVGSAGQKRIPTSFVLDYKIPLPPLAEQAAIVAHIDAVSAKINQAIDQAQQQIDKLSEYKTVLINAAVTGKIKVA